MIRDAMEAQNMVGISRLVISRRERAVISSHVVRVSFCGRCATETKFAMKTAISRRSAMKRPIPR